MTDQVHALKVRLDNALDMIIAREDALAAQYHTDQNLLQRDIHIAISDALSGIKEMMI